MILDVFSSKISGQISLLKKKTPISTYADTLDTKNVPYYCLIYNLKD